MLLLDNRENVVRYDSLSFYLSTLYVQTQQDTLCNVWTEA